MHDRHRSIMWELPIQLDTSTSSYADAQKRQDHNRQCCDGVFVMQAGDMATFMRNNYLRLHSVLCCAMLCCAVLCCAID